MTTATNQSGRAIVTASGSASAVRLVHQFLTASATAEPSATALIEGDRAVSYSELDERSNRVANLLRSEGVQRHDRVVLALENGPDLVVCYFGVLKAGAVAVPLPAGARSDRLQAALADCSPAACIVDAATARAAVRGSALANVQRLFVSGGAGARGQRLDAALERSSALCPDVRTIDIDLAAVIYTSGSTGAPRGVVLSHRNIVANTRSIVSYLELTARDRVMCVLPFYYVYGLSLLHTHVAVGGSIVIDNRFAFPNTVLNGMQAHCVTGFAGVPSTFAILLQRSAIAEMEFPHLRYVTQAGGGMPPARILEWLEHGPQVPFYVMYGATEASARLTYLPPAQLRRKLGSIGRPIPNVDILVIKDDGNAAAPGEIGELVARGANISAGYWNNVEETAAKFGTDGYRTGDLGYVDDEGFLYLTGRRQDMIKVGAHRVGAKEIEDVICEHPDVLEAAVIGRPHDILGEAPVAFVSLRGTVVLDAESLRGFCRTRLAAHKIPVDVVFRAELPKLPGVGKIDKHALRSA